MFFHEHNSAPRTTHWVYDDPSGVPEPPTLIIPSIPPLRTKGA